MTLPRNTDGSGVPLVCRSLVVAPCYADTSVQTQPWQAFNENPTSRDKRLGLRPRGVWNAGQSCHLGASIAALSAASNLRTWLIHHHAARGSLYVILKHYLLEAAISRERFGLDPRPMLRILESTGWKSRHAQDAHETMARLLDILETWNSSDEGRDDRNRGFTESDDESSQQGCAGRVKLKQTWRRQPRMPFSLITSSSQRCLLCACVSPTAFQANSVVLLPVPPQPRELASLFVESLMSEELVEMRCESCGEYCRHLRSTNVQKLPDVLILHLQKAVYESRGVATAAGQVMLSERITLPEGRRLDDWKTTRTYVLRSVVRHWGVASGYNSHFDVILRQGYAQGLGCLSREERWWHIDDDHVSQSSRQRACDPKSAYLVVYEAMETH